MTATLIDASSAPTGGDATEPLAWKSPSFPEGSTYLELRTVTNPAVRDVLAHFALESQSDLWVSETIPGAVVLQRAVNGEVDQRIRLFISGSTADMRHGQVLRWLASSTGQLLQTYEEALSVYEFGIGGTGSIDPFVPSITQQVPTSASDVVEVVEWLARQLDVPDGDILKAARIKRRNWHNWKNGRRPRLETQGHLWALVNSIRSLSELFDDAPALWFQAGGPARRELLTSGNHRKIVQDALLEAALQGEFTSAASRRRRKKSAAGFFE